MGTKLPAGLNKRFYLCHTGQKICPTLVPRGIHLLFPNWRQTCSYAWILKSKGITLYLPRLFTVQVSVWKRRFRIQGSWPQKGELSPRWLPSFPSRPFCAYLPVPLLMTPIQMRSSKDSCAPGQNLTWPLLQSVVQPGSLYKHILERAACWDTSYAR